MECTVEVLICSDQWKILRNVAVKNLELSQPSASFVPNFKCSKAVLVPMLEHHMSCSITLGVKI